MKVSLKLSLLILFIAATINADAQKYAIEAGYTNPMRFGKSVGTTFFYGGKLGVTARYDLKNYNNVSLLTGILYSVVYADRQSGFPNSGVVIGSGLTLLSTDEGEDITDISANTSEIYNKNV